MGRTPNHLILEVQDVIKTYNTGDISFTALNQVNIDIQSGEFLVLLENQAQAKPHLLNVIAGVTELTKEASSFHQTIEDIPDNHSYS